MNRAVIACAALALVGCKKEQPRDEMTATPPADAPPAKAKEPAPPATAPIAPVQGTPELVEPMGKLKSMHGVWRGPAEGMEQTGPFALTQTERVGPMLGGDVLVVEGRGFDEDGSTGFNAFAVISYDLQAKKYEIRTYTKARSGTFELKLTDDGYVWDTPAGPKAIVRFTATIDGKTWKEVGEYIAEGQPPMKTFEMNLERVGDTDWPLRAPVAPK
jgi:hypothetical protein